MKTFVVNCGSSSIKYQLFDMSDESVLAKGIVERIGTQEASLEHEAHDGRETQRGVDAPNHTEGLKDILGVLCDGEVGVLSSIDEIDGIGHRVVHGGEALTHSIRIDDDVLATLREMIPLAPLHNPANIAGIEGAMAAMPDVPHVAVFDTAFLSTLSPAAFRYAVPTEWYTKHRVRRYGFHGTSHRYVTGRAAEVLGKSIDQVNIVTCHLGNGCSMTAVAGGKAVDHSMGMTPLEGLVMGTRSGDIDPAVIPYMVSQGLTVEQIDKVLNKESGLLGLSELGNDMRDLLAARDEGNGKAALAVDVFCRRIVKYIGAYCAILPSVAAIVLTGGIGENSRPVRKQVCEQLGSLGVEFDAQRNDATVRACGPITTDDSELAVWIIPTNEELVIARDTADLVGGAGN
ncbi:MAG: acetate/propionate family kinase [Planctomycetota bacterium]|jgi:acetate kinase